MDIYQPAEDSYFLSEIIKKCIRNKGARILEIGCGSGIQLQTLKELGVKNIFSCDINPKSVAQCKKLGFNCIKSDLFEKIKGKFDWVIFNPPYLPENRFDRFPDTTGGKKGDETVLRFLKQLKGHLAKDGKCLLLVSSHTPKNRISKELVGYSVKLIAEKRLFHEELHIFLITL